MSDVADMLGISKPTSKNPIDNILNPQVNERAAAIKAAKKKPKGMKREVFDLLGPDGLVPVAQSAPLSSGFKSKRQSGLKGKWNFAAIVNSARSDGLTALHHWVKADISFTDYPYAKFNTHIDSVQYTDAEYEQYLTDPHWSKEDTDKLMALCNLYDLRWPVVHDRYEGSVFRGVEDLMSRYYTILQKMRQAKNIPKNDDIAVIDVDKERKRRVMQDALFRRTREDEAEEMRVKEELKAVEAILKKNKRPTKAAPATAAPPQIVNGQEMASFSASLLDSKGLLTATITNPLPETYTAPQPGRPALQSSRLYLSSPAALQLSKSLVGKMQSYLRELGMPDRVTPSQAVCDTVDAIRQDAVLLLSMHNSLNRKDKDAGGVGNKAASKTAGTSKPKPKGGGGAQKKPVSTTTTGQTSTSTSTSLGASKGVAEMHIKLEGTDLGAGVWSGDGLPGTGAEVGMPNFFDMFDPRATDDMPLNLLDTNSPLADLSMPSSSGHHPVSISTLPSLSGPGDSADASSSKKRTRSRKSDPVENVKQEPVDVEPPAPKKRKSKG